MKKIKYYIILIYLLPVLSYSQTLNLEQALEIASQENNDLKIEKLENEKKVLEVRKKWKAFLPTLDLEYGAGEYSKSYRVNKHHRGSEDKLVVKLPLFMGFKNIKNLKKAKLELKKTRYNSKRLTTIIRESVINKYFQILELKSIREVLIKNQEALIENDERIAKLYNSNKLVLHTQVLESQEMLTYNKSRILDLANRLEEATYELKYLLNLPEDSKIELIDSHKEIGDVDSLIIDEDIVRLRGKGNRVKVGKIDVEIAKTEKEIARSNYYPKIWLEGDYNYTAARKHRDDSRVSVIVNWNLFKWGSDMDTVRQKEIVEEQKRLKVVEELHEGTMELRVKYGKIRRTQLEISSKRYELERAMEIQERAAIEYKNATITISRYLSALTNLEGVERDYYTLKRELASLIDDYNNTGK